MEANNVQAMREALLALKELDFNKEEDCHAFYRIIDKALAKPPRNCDVGTADEQVERFNHQCFEHHTGRCSPHCKTLPAKTFQACALKWAQMPYEEPDTNK